MFHLVVVGDRDPMVFALDLAPVQLALEGCDVHFGSFTPRREEVVLDGQLLLGGNEIPRSELHDHHFYGLIFIPDVVLLQILNVLHVDSCDGGFD